MLNIGTRKKENDGIASGSVLSLSARHVQTRTLVCVKPDINNRHPHLMMGLPTFSTIVLFKFNKIKNS